MVSLRSWSRRISLAVASVAAAWFAFPATGQAQVSAGSCTVSPGPYTQFAGDPNSYYDAGALPLSAGATQTVQVCVNVAHPTVRLYIDQADPGASVTVGVVSTDSSGGSHTVATSSVSGTPGLSAPVTLSVVNNGSLGSSGTALVTLSLTAQSGNVDVQNTWVDPWGG